MSSGALTQLIASGGGGPYVVQIPTSSDNSNTTQPPSQSDQPPLVSYVCLNDMCMINNPALFGSLPAFASMEDCQKVCGVKPSSLRPQ